MKIKNSYTIFTLFKLVNGVVRCVDCQRGQLPYSESGLLGIALADYLSTLDLVIDDCLRYALFEADGFKVKFRRFGNSYYIYTTYYE